MHCLICLVLVFLCFNFSIPKPALAEDPDTQKSNKQVTISNLKNAITGIQLQQDDNSSKIVLELMYPLSKMPAIMATLETVSFEIDAEYNENKRNKNEIWNLVNKKPKVENKSLFEINSTGFIKTITWTNKTNKAIFEIKRPYYSPVNLQQQEKPSALVIEFPRQYFNKETQEIKPGLTKHFIRTVNSRGPVTAHILEIDLSSNNISVGVGFPDKDKIKSKETLSKIVKDNKAYAGINANYFDVKVGNPLGTLITDSTWLIGPVYDRVAIGFSKDNMVLIDQVMLLGNATIHRGFRKKPFAMFEIDGLNIPPALYKKVGLFTLNWDKEIVLPKNKLGVVVKNDCIKTITDEKIEMPENGYVLVSDAKYILNFFKRKDCIDLKWETTPDWSTVTEAVSGGPYLIKDREVFVDLQKQQFKFTKKDTYAPRSAIGIDDRERLFLIAVDGRRSGYSVGVTLDELAEMLKKLNLKTAINLDGGGSTTLVIGEKIINTLSERHERKISNALLIFYKGKD